MVNFYEPGCCNTDGAYVASHSCAVDSLFSKTARQLKPPSDVSKYLNLKGKYYLEIYDWLAVPGSPGIRNLSSGYYLKANKRCFHQKMVNLFQRKTFA